MQTKDSKKIRIGNLKIGFTNKKITAYAGYSLLAAFFKKIKLKEVLEEVIPIVEVSPNSKGIYSKMIAYFLMIYAGGSRFSHLLYLGCREILGKLFGVKELPLASTTLTRLFNKIDRMKQVEEMSEGLWGFMRKLIRWEEIKEDWVTLDSTTIPRYGKQEGSEKGYNPDKKGRGSHSPILAFLNRSRYVINVWNRPGNVKSSNNVIGFFKNTYERIKGLIRVAGVLADGGYYLKEFIELIEGMGMKYVIAACLYSTLQEKIYEIKDWKEIDEGIWIGEIYFGHEGWGKERRYIVTRQDTGVRENATGKQLKLFGVEEDVDRYRYDAWVTNLEEGAYEVWKRYRARGNDENAIKELKEDFALEGFSMKKFYSTEAAMIMRVLIYNLFVLFRNEVLGVEERSKRLLTLRYKYFVMGGIMGRDGRDEILRISVITRKIKSKLIYLFNRIERYKPLGETNCNAFG